MRLLRDAARGPQPRPESLGAALAMPPSLPRDEAIRLLRERLTTLETVRDRRWPPPLSVHRHRETSR